MKPEAIGAKTEKSAKMPWRTAKKINESKMRKEELKKIFLSDKMLAAMALVVMIMAAAWAYLSWEKGRQAQGPADDSAEEASVVHWTGAAGDGKWSTAKNWDSEKAPGDETDVIFDSGTGDSVIDADFYGKIKSLRIDGYGGKIIQPSRLIINADYRQASGEFEARADMEVKGDFSQENDSVFTVRMGDVRIAGDLEIGDGFGVDSSGAGAVYMKAGDSWKMLMLDASGRKGYFAAKEEGGPMETWSFYNGTNGLVSYISQGRGWTVMPETGEWKWNYLLKSMDRGEKTVKGALEAGIFAAENKVSMDRGNGIEEWYENDFRGVEQGFTIKEKPEGEGSLVLSGEVELGNLAVRKNTEKRIILSWNGYDVMDYGELSASDAGGKELKTKMYLENIKGDKYSLKISVDDSGAQYPITIDPLVIQPEIISPVLGWTGSIGAMGDPAEVAAKAGYGRVAVPAGDVDGDGRQELLVTAVNYSNVETNEGKAYLYRDDGAGNFSSSPIWEYESDVAEAFFGYSAACAGDVDGDGYDDVIIGAYGYGGGTGKVYLFLGGDPLTGLKSSPAWTATGERTGDYFGWSVASAGDVDGDALDDMIVGAKFYDLSSGKTGITSSGKVYVFFGKSNVNLIPDAALSAGWSYPSEGHESLANKCNELLGFSVSSAGDVNLDGVDDIIAGAPQNDGGDESGKGAAYLFLGHAVSGPSSEPDYIFKNGAVKSFFGNPVSKAGDINKDGYPDLLIGASRWSKTFVDGYGSHEGALYAYYGRWDASKGESYFNLTPDWDYYGDKKGAYLGSAWKIAGDVNGDGYGDAVAGACQYSGNHTIGGSEVTYSAEGQAMLFTGSKAGLGNGRAWEITGGKKDAQMGWNVSSMGDVNGDGASEFTISSHMYDSNATGGEAYLYKGVNQGITPPSEICYNGIDDDGDGDIDMDDSDCAASTNKKSLITVTASTVDRSDWFTDSANIDTDGDGIKDSRDTTHPDYLKYRYYALCDADLPSYDSQSAKDAIMVPYVHDYSYKPCDRDDVHDDLHNSDVGNVLYIQPDSKKFKIKAEAMDNEGVGSILIEWRSGNPISASGNEWKEATTGKHACTNYGDGLDSCEVCAVGNTDCAPEDRLIDYASLGIPSGSAVNRLFFRVTVTDSENESITTGYDDDTTRQPVFDRYFRMYMCSNKCHTCTNTAAAVTLVGFTPPSNPCDGLNYKLDWDFPDPDGQSFYELQVRDADTGEVLTSVQESSETEAILSEGFLDGPLKHDTKYQWRIRAYDNSSEDSCQAVSEWSEWSDIDDATKTFTTPPDVPDPTFDMDIENTWTASCGCSSSKTVTFKSTTAIVGTAAYKWKIDGAEVGGVTEDSFTKLFIDDTDITHTIHLTVTDDNGACTGSRILDLGRRNPTWTEMAPPLG